MIRPVCQCWSVLVLLVLALVCLSTARTVAQNTLAISSTTPAQLLEAFQNTAITTVVLDVPHYTVNQQAWDAATSPGSPLLLARNFIITSMANPPSVLDLRQLDKRVKLGRDVTLTFRDLVLMNARRLSGFGVDMVVGSDNATVITENVIRVKGICQQPGQQNLASALTYPVLPGYPPNKVAIVDGLCVPNIHNGQSQLCFNEGLKINSLATAETQSNVEGSGFDEGYTLVQRNVTRVCQSYLDPDCLRQHYPDYCWAKAAVSVQDKPSTALSAGAIAGIVVAGDHDLLVRQQLILIACCYHVSEALNWHQQLPACSDRATASTKRHPWPCDHMVMECMLVSFMQHTIMSDMHRAMCYSCSCEPTKSLVSPSIADSSDRVTTGVRHRILCMHPIIAWRR
eukprot:GHRR01013139.1.p1 GENE.GHRR01013139.1~~GHRR01013139.1.p1  ORF type:complete len:399 (+),score=64.10 GHRR01013139.1:103-1299(+)